MGASDLERQFLFLVRVAKAPAPELEYKFLKDRRFRFDFAWPDRMVAVEVEGGVWTAGRHNRPSGFIADCEKYSLAALEGWKVLRVTGDHIKDGKALKWLQRALAE